ncbi:MAG: MaoC/PaaZ C-terminal domain-containing protein [bacterium]
MFKEERMHQRLFTFDDQIIFSKLSGDNNPIHIDRIASRRYLLGQPVVHGIHALLWALDTWLIKCTHPIRITSLKAHFPNPTYLEKEVSYREVSNQNRKVEIELTSCDSKTAYIEASWDIPSHRRGDSPKNDYPTLRPPCIVPQDKICGHKGTLDLLLNTKTAGHLFPSLMKWASPVEIATLLATTRLTGTQCPGLHSLYSEIALYADDNPRRTQLEYNVTSFDLRFHLAIIAVRGPFMTGNLKAFVRPIPKQQTDYSNIIQLIHEGEFRDERALIIGGSRGLGEVTAKLLNAGGAETRITYYQGKEDAERVVNDIVANGGRTDFLHFNVLKPAQSIKTLIKNNWFPTHLYYFATPFIFSAKKRRFSSDLFKQFCAYYVTGFYETVDSLRAYGLQYAFYPSSKAIDDIPANLGEYASAKMAGEMLCSFLGKYFPGLVLYKPRLPRLATDQTASLSSVDNLDPVSVLLKELRSFKSTK